MAKGEKPRVGITQDEPTTAEVLAALFFAVRLFRNPPANPEARDVAAFESVADASALIAAFAKLDT